MLIDFPSILSIDETRAGNRIRQLGEGSSQVSGAALPFTRGRLNGLLLRADGSAVETLVVPNAAHIPETYTRVLEANVDGASDTIDLRNVKWVRHPLQADARHTDRSRKITEIIESWTGAFSYRHEDPSRGIRGLRTPQIGAVHAVHKHWSITDAVGTIVMPTGTGKTETMLSVLVSAQIPKLLVVVPTDALRSQIAAKFLTLGVLKEPGFEILTAEAQYPIVATLQHIPRNEAEVDEVFGNAQVIVTTSSVAGQCGETIQTRMAHRCPYLFIDEAHHAEAPTWSAFKERFKGRRILQFTATPFREDGKPLDGEIIFKYPLKKAQEEGYFKPICFRPVVEFNLKRADKAIAEKAIEQLRADYDKGHIVMARVDTVARAKDVFELYNQYPEFKPVQLHTGVKSGRQREAARQQIISGESRIVVCVDMLGEGFDLPELKIAAFHDIRKTLAVTLQLAGRFTRSRPDLGEATFIANTADVHVQDELRKLYTRDPDWNLLLPELSERMIGEQVSLQQFLQGFTNFTEEIPLKSVRPATSTVVYRTRCEDWKPENFRAGIPGLASCEQVHHAINNEKHTLVVVTAWRLPLPWTDIETLYGWEWELYAVIWSPEQDLLFINSSTNAGEYRALAEAIAGNNATLMRGQQVFRTFSGVKRLQLQQVGLTEQLGRNVRYTGRMGTDVAPGVPEVHRRRARKTVLSGTGYEGGARVTVGASRKGRIWSHRRDRVDQLVEWCKDIGTKLLDNSIDPDEVLRGTLDSKTVTERPAKMPIAIDWPEEMYRTPEAIWTVGIDGEEYSLSEMSIEVVSPSPNNPLRLAIVSETQSAELELELFEEEDEDELIPNYRFTVLGGKTVQVGSEGITSFFYENPPVFWFVDGSSLEGNQYVELKTTYPPYDRAKIEAWDWTGIDLRKESQGVTKDRSSIQARVIHELKTRNYAMIVDDDGKGETADVVTIRLTGDQNAPSSIDLEFFIVNIPKRRRRGTA
jgi:superfamily II DNA or RNA helicase